MLFFRIASLVLLLIGISHLAGHFLLIPQLNMTANFSGAIPGNETEHKLLDLMNNYSRDVGGFKISMMDIQNGLSLCYSIFFLWTGLLNLLLLKGLVRNKRLLSQISLLNVIVLVIGAFISTRYFFWLPMASFGLSAILYLIAALRIRREV
jgi:hypothetical protein